jgi:hypothetical protein
MDSALGFATLIFSPSKDGDVPPDRLYSLP